MYNYVGLCRFLCMFMYVYVGIYIYIYIYKYICLYKNMCVYIKLCTFFIRICITKNFSDSSLRES